MLEQQQMCQKREAHDPHYWKTFSISDEQMLWHCPGWPGVQVLMVVDGDTYWVAPLGSELPAEPPVWIALQRKPSRERTWVDTGSGPGHVVES